MPDVDQTDLAALADEVERIDKMLKTNPRPPLLPAPPPERFEASKSYPKVFAAWVEAMLAARHEWARPHGLIPTDTPHEQLDERFGMAGLMDRMNGCGQPFALGSLKRGKRTAVDPETAEREASAANWIDCFRKLDATNAARPHAIVAHGERLDDFTTLAAEYGLTPERLSRSWWHPSKCHAVVVTRSGLASCASPPDVSARARA